MFLFLFFPKNTKTEPPHQSKADRRRTHNNTMNETSFRPRPRRTTTLLEDLRKQLVAGNILEPTTEEEAEQKMNLILAHKAEFPSKLRAAIREASEVSEHPAQNQLFGGEDDSSMESRSSGESIPSKKRISRFFLRCCRLQTTRRRRPRTRTQPEIFLRKVYNAVKIFFLGAMYRDYDRFQTLHWLLGWNGLDSDVDTEAEAELAIRCFPKILNQTSHLERTGLHRARPIHMLLSHARAVSFVPLFAELGVELGRFKTEEKGGLACSNMSVVGQLLCNRIALTVESSRAHFRGEAPDTTEVDKRSLAVLVRLGERGLVTKEDIYSCGYDLIIDLFVAASYREPAFIEKRLRLLIDWNPTTLTEFGGKGGYNLLDTYFRWNNYHDKWNFYEEHVEVRIFELIFELGMFYFPLEMGYVFHNTTFQLACERIGTEKVGEMIHSKLLKTLAESKQRKKKSNKKRVTLQSLVVSAAANGDISLDGLYTLVRCDPAMALLPQSSTATNVRCDPLPEPSKQGSVPSRKPSSGSPPARVFNLEAISIRR